MVEGEDLEPAVRALTERIAVVREAIDQEMAAREHVEKRQEIVCDGPEQELEALREQLTEARAKIAKLNAAQPVTRKSTARRGPYWSGAKGHRARRPLGRGRHAALRGEPPRRREAQEVA